MPTSTMDLYRGIRRIREFESQVIELFTSGDVPGFTHTYIGQEAVATGVCAALQPQDRVGSNHRGHGHILAKGGDPKRMMSEILGRSTGYCQGMGGELHIMDASIRILGANGIVGANLPIAAGAALHDMMAGDNAVTVAFLGDGATAEGTFGETLNIAALWNLPLVLVCENNRYGEWTATADAVAGSISSRGDSYGIPGETVDGQDVWAVLSGAQAAVDRARAGDGPSLIEAETYRWFGHMYGEEAMLGGHVYRPEEEVADWKSNRDPVTLTRDRARDEGISEGDLDSIDEEVRQEMVGAVEYATNSPLPEPEQALAHVFGETVVDT